MLWNHEASGAGTEPQHPIDQPDSQTLACCLQHFVPAMRHRNWSSIHHFTPPAWVSHRTFWRFSYSVVHAWALLSDVITQNMYFGLKRAVNYNLWLSWLLAAYDRPTAFIVQLRDSRDSPSVIVTCVNNIDCGKAYYLLKITTCSA